MSKRMNCRWTACGLVAVLLAMPTLVAAQTEPEAAPSRGATAPEKNGPGASGQNVPLSTRQEAIAIRYRRFESTLLQLAEYLRKTDPDRAE
ncbi:MAG TPA: hypothetical protein EYP14_01500, partial [Planctomycetaceae bacterium]|nr:hypothetical protein [Planctomycetaceae bacterium]